MYDVQSHNVIYDIGAISIAAALEVNNSLQRLDLVRSTFGFIRPLDCCVCK